MHSDSIAFRGILDHGYHGKPPSTAGVSMNPKYQIEPLDKTRHNREAFSCGVAALDSYLKERASREAAKKVATVYVLCEIDSSHVIGYYTLSMTGIKLTSLPEKVVKNLRLPRYPI